MLNRIPGSLLARASLLSLAVVVGVGCAQGMGDPTSGPGGTGSTTTPGSTPKTLADALQLPTKLDIAATDTAGTGSSAVIDAEQLSTGLSKQLDLNVLGGYLDVRALSDGELYFDELSVDIDDIQIPSSVLPPNGLHLTGIAATLSAPISFDASWAADGNGVTADVTLDLSVDWGIARADGSVYPLSPVHVPNVPVHIEITRDASGAISLQLSGAHDGVFFDWAKLLDLSNLQVDFRCPAQQKQQ